jgi:hypothetical protein
LVFKIDNPVELALSGIDPGNDGGRSFLAPRQSRTLYTQWLQQGWVVHAHARSVATGVPHNTRAKRTRDLQGRAIQYPLLPVVAGQMQSEWKAQALDDWKTAVLDLMAHMHAHPERAPQQISCEFIPFADYGGGARYSIWDNNLACARWLRDAWDGFTHREPH